MLALVVISPITSTKPVLVQVSHATRLNGSCSISASSTASDTASQILSGCPSVTDSDVNKRFSICPPFCFLLGRVSIVYLLLLLKVPITQNHVNHIAFKCAPIGLRQIASRIRSAQFTFKPQAECFPVILCQRFQW